MRSLLMVCLGMSLAPFSHADKVNLYLNNDTFSLNYSTAAFAEHSNVDLGWLHSTDNGDIANLGFQVEQSAGGNNTYALGGQLIGIFNDVKNASALALGGRFNVSLPSDPKVHFGGHAWFAPKVTSFGDATGYQDWGLRVGYQALERGEIFVGYQYAKVEYKSNFDVKVQDNIHVGMELTF